MYSYPPSTSQDLLDRPKAVIQLRARAYMNRSKETEKLTQVGDFKKFLAVMAAAILNCYFGNLRDSSSISAGIFYDYFPFRLFVLSVTCFKVFNAIFNVVRTDSGADEVF